MLAVPLEGLFPRPRSVVIFWTVIFEFRVPLSDKPTDSSVPEPGGNCETDAVSDQSVACPAGSQVIGKVKVFAWTNEGTPTKTTAARTATQSNRRFFTSFLLVNARRSNKGHARPSKPIDECKTNKNVAPNFKETPRPRIQNCTAAYPGDGSQNEDMFDAPIGHQTSPSCQNALRAKLHQHWVVLL